MSQRRRRKHSESESDSEGEQEDSVAAGWVAECVRYVLCREGSKAAIRRADLQRHLAATLQVPPAAVPRLLNKANALLKTVYGYKLLQIDAKSGVQFMVVLAQECAPSLLSLQPAPAAAAPQHRRLLTAALTHIFMSGGVVKEEDMWQFLAEAGLAEPGLGGGALAGAGQHAARRLLTHTFTKQMYLTYEKEPEGEVWRHVFRWGQRAAEELPKMFLLNKMALAFDKRPDYWIEQYKSAQEEDEAMPVECG